MSPKSEELTRAKLIVKLQRVEPAIAINQLIPLLTHYWFTGSHLMAYNDQIALQVPLETDFRGAVPGKFLELLNVDANRKGGLELTHAGSELVVKQGKRTNFRLAMLDPNFIFTMPEFTRGRKKLVAGLMEALVDAVEHCLISVGRDTSTVEQLGITLEAEGKTTTLYATDGATISRAKLGKDTFKLEARAILPTKFCEQMLQLYRGLEDKTDADFELASSQEEGEQEAQRYALFRAGETRLYGRLLETRNPLNFRGTVEYHLPRNHDDQLVEVPSRLQAALERACIVCDAQRRLTHVILDDGKMVLKSKSDTEEVTDELPYLHKGSTRVEVKVEPKLLRKAQDYDYDQMMIHELCVVMAKGSSVYLISCSTA